MFKTVPGVKLRSIFISNVPRCVRFKYDDDDAIPFVVRLDMVQILSKSGRFFPPHDNDGLVCSLMLEIKKKIANKSDK